LISVVVVAPVPVIPVIPVVTIVPIVVKGWTSAIISTIRAPAVRTTPITTVLAITTSLIRPRRGCLWWRLYSVVDLSFDLWDLDTAHIIVVVVCPIGHLVLSTKEFATQRF